MNIKLGDVVRSNAKPEYGYGIVVALRDNKVEVVFQEAAQARVLLASSLEVTNPPDAIRSSLALPNRGRTGKTTTTAAAEYPLDIVKLNRLVSAFLSAAEKGGIEKLDDKIHRAFVVRSPDADALRGAVQSQLRKWVDTNRSGRYQVAIAPARELYQYLFPDEERS